MVNGKVQDLRGKVERAEVTYGVSSGEFEIAFKHKCTDIHCVI